MGCDPHLTYTRDTDIFKEGTTAVQSVTKIIKKKKPKQQQNFSA